MPVLLPMSGDMTNRAMGFVGELAKTLAMGKPAIPLI